MNVGGDHNARTAEKKTARRCSKSLVLSFFLSRSKHSGEEEEASARGLLETARHEEETQTGEPQGRL